MNRRLLIIISCALVLSACVAYLVYRAATIPIPSGKQVATMQIVVAARDLAAGALLRESDLKMTAWEGSPPKGAIRKMGDGVNRAVASPIFENEAVTENRLSAKGSGGGLAATIPPGMRACAVKVNEVVDMAGFIVPGMRVDVLMTGLPPGGNAFDGPRVRTLLQNIQVLSAGTNFQGDREGKPEQAQVVSLLVTPSQAEVLSLASNETHIQLVLRNPMDTELAEPPGTFMSDLFGGSAPRAPERVSALAPVPALATPAPKALEPVVPEHLYTVEVSNGSVHTMAKFARPAGNR